MNTGAIVAIGAGLLGVVGVGAWVVLSQKKATPTVPSVNVQTPVGQLQQNGGFVGTVSQALTLGKQGADLANTLSQSGGALDKLLSS